ncbi:hypothetical protein [Salinicoccus sp. Marseille-QA3877]
MKSNLTSQIDKELASIQNSRYKIERINKLNMNIANQVNSFMAKTLISYTLLGMSLLLVLFYIQSYILPHPGIVVEISLAFVLLPVFSIAVSVISLVGKDNWEHKKFIFGFIPTFSKKKKRFLENDAEVLKDIKILKELTAKPDVKKLTAATERRAENRKKNAVGRPAPTRTYHEEVHIPPAYRTEKALIKIRGYLTNRRADNLKEAINLYEQEENFRKKEKALENQKQEIEDLKLTIEAMNRDEIRKSKELKLQKAQYEHKLRKSIDDLKYYK